MLLLRMIETPLKHSTVAVSTAIRKASNQNISTKNVDTKSFGQFCQHLSRVRVRCEEQNEIYQWPKYLLHELGGDRNAALLKLSTITPRCDEYTNSLIELEQLEEIKSEDPELLQMIDEERSEMQQRMEEEREEIVDHLIQDVDLEDCEGILLEIIPGVGGLEASLFAMELFNTYNNYLFNHGYTFDPVTFVTNEAGGLQTASVMCTPGDAFRLLRHESGTHRVQRVPQTEARGRIHTSTASVAVIPKYAAKFDELKTRDIKKHFSRPSGPGGQKVNTTNSQVQLIHTPTGISVRCSETRVLGDNLQLALRELTCKVHQLQSSAIASQINSARYQHLTLRSRSDKIRTYNYPQDRITDHRFHISTRGVTSHLSGSTAFREYLSRIDAEWNESEKREILQQLMQED